MPDFFDSPAASFDDPIALLMACHERVRHYSALLLKLAGYLPEHGADVQARQAATSILRYFDIAAPLHHQDEEDDLFPLLAERGDDSLRLLLGVSMLEEHVELANLWREVRVILQAIESGEIVELPLALAERFASRYPEHALIEDERIYPLAEKFLSKNELALLGARMAARRKVEFN